MKGMFLLALLLVVLLAVGIAISTSCTKVEDFPKKATAASNGNFKVVADCQGTVIEGLATSIPGPQDTGLVITAYSKTSLVWLPLAICVVDFK